MQNRTIDLWNRSKRLLAFVVVGNVLLSSCGVVAPSEKNGAEDSNPTAAASPSPVATTDGQGVARSFDKALALGPDGLALKIRSAFGAGLTSTVAGGREVDYVQVNGTLFTGAISPDPNVKIPKQLASVSYFLALNGLADVVARNYSVKMATGTATRKCNQIDDAKLMVQVVYPPVVEVDRDQIAQAIVDSCNLGVPETIRAIITSYAFALDTAM